MHGSYVAIFSTVPGETEFGGRNREGEREKWEHVHKQYVLTNLKNFLDKLVYLQLVVGSRKTS